MNPPDTDNGNELTNENELVNGGSVKLAKESIGGILNQGEFLQVDDLKFQLDDLEAHGETTSAILSVLDANDNVLEKEKVDPGDTQEFNIGGNMYRFHVYKVAPGYTFGAKWADVAVFSHEIECEDGQELDSDEDTNPEYECVLGWKNLEAEGEDGDDDEPERDDPDALRTIIIYTDDIEDLSSSGEDTLEAGDYVPIVQDPEAWRLSYKGLDLTSEDRYSLEFEIKTSDSDESSACIVFAPYVEVSSGDSGSVFEVSPQDDAGGGGTLSDDEFIIALNQEDYVTGDDGAVCDSDWDDVVETDGSDYDIESGSVFMMTSPSGQHYGVVLYPNAADYNTQYGDGMLVEYEDIGDGDSDFPPPNGGAILIQDAGDIGQDDDLLGDLLDSDSPTSGFGGFTAGDPDYLFAVAEKAGTGSSNEFVDYFIFGIDDTGTGAPGDATFDFDSASADLSITSDDEEILYGHAVANTYEDGDYCDSTGSEYYCGVEMSGPVSEGFEMVEEGYISERGSVFEMIDDTSVEFDMAHKLAKAQWWLGPSETSAAASTATVVTLGEGESTTVGGVTVKVLEITETVGACSANGGAVSCSADMSPVSAVIMPDNEASVEVAVPYTGTFDNLVVLDTDAVGINTLVSVGGDKVNTITENLLKDSAVDWEAENMVVKEVVEGKKIVVAGKEAADTLEAAKDFVKKLQRV
jgi:hypothetical protein